MATLILTTIGTALGGPIGGAIGGLIGQSIDQGLFGSQRKGPRIGDLSVQTSSYGSPVPRIYGKMRVAGTVVWANDIQEEEGIEGGGKSSPQRVTYSYFANLAVALSSRPIQSVGRIWADGKLIRGSAGDFKVRTKFRLMQGGEDQPVDPLIGSAEGIANAPAYRGMALAVFEGLELAEFGGRIPLLTFEVIADGLPVPLDMLLADCSGGAIDAQDARPIAGYAAHGTSVRDSIGHLIELCGVTLAERDSALRTPEPGPVTVLVDDELGCEADGNAVARIERRRASDCEMATSLALTYYDPERDFQAGQMRASSGVGGTRDERAELPAVLTASDARQLVEAALARRWQDSDRLRMRLPPTRIGLDAGDAIQLASTSQALTIRSIAIEGMAILVEAQPAPVAIEAVPADPGRPVAQPDLAVGRSELALFELPPSGDAPAPAPRVFAAASNEGRWKPLPVEWSLSGNPLAGTAIAKRAVIGRAETVLEARDAMIADEISSVVVRLVCEGQLLLNADWDALMSGANLALIGSELVQFGRAEQLESGRFRLSRLLRGRRGTEWAATAHQADELFCLIDPAALAFTDLTSAAVGATIKAAAHGIGDVAPLPEASRTVSGEAMRPPPPCHLRLSRAGAGIDLQWTRRSHRHWSWGDGVGDGADAFPERYRVTVTGPDGQAAFETDETSLSLSDAQIPAAPGQGIAIDLATIGPMALSHAVSTTIIL